MPYCVPIQATMLALALLFLCVLSPIHAGLSYLESRNTCGQDYSQCSPHGSASNAPDINSVLPSLYVDLLESTNSNTNHKRSLHLLDIRSSLSVCCTLSPPLLFLRPPNITYRRRWHALSPPPRPESTILLCTSPYASPGQSHLSPPNHS